MSSISIVAQLFDRDTVQYILNNSIQRTFHSVVSVCYSLALIVAHRNHAVKCR